MTVGCVSSKIDVTDDPYYWGAYRPGDLYATTQRVFLVKDNGYTVYRPKYESSRIFPETIEAYLNDPGRWPRVVSVLDIGSSFRIDRFTVNPYGLGLPRIWGSILGGPHDGWAIEMSFLSPYTGSGVGLGPDEEYLVKVD